MWLKIAGWVSAALTALPSLITGVEALWKGQPKSGAQKWISVEQALSGSIALIANQVSTLAPGTPPDVAAQKVVIFTKAVNDAFVKLCNDLGVFQTSS